MLGSKDSQMDCTPPGTMELDCRHPEAGEALEEGGRWELMHSESEALKRQGLSELLPVEHLA